MWPLFSRYRSSSPPLLCGTGNSASRSSAFPMCFLPVSTPIQFGGGLMMGRPQTRQRAIPFALCCAPDRHRGARGCFAGKAARTNCGGEGGREGGEQHANSQKTSYDRPPAFFISRVRESDELERGVRTICAMRSGTDINHSRRGGRSFAFIKQ